MSRRRDRSSPPPPRGTRPAAEREAPRTEREPSRGPSYLVQVASLLGLVAVVTLIAELAGADSLGVALGVAQIVFAVALVAWIVRGP
jgi:hypothetical protein